MLSMSRGEGKGLPKEAGSVLISLWFVSLYEFIFLWLLLVVQLRFCVCLGKGGSAGDQEG